MKIGVLGGTFNPIHYAHLLIAEEVITRRKLDTILFVPTYIPPHKEVNVESQIDEIHRVNMIKLAIEDHHLFKLDTFEIDQKGVSYTHKTLKYIYNNYDVSGKLEFIIGSDLVPKLYTWRNYDELVKLCDFLVLRRSELDPNDYTEKYPFIKVIDTNVGMDVSSTEIRTRIRNGLSVKFLLPNSKVEDYIKENKLYS